MFDFFKKPTLGLDLSDLSLKIIQLKRKKQGLPLVNFVKEDIPAGFIKGGEIKKEKELIVILKEALKKIKGEFSQRKQVICNLPEEKVFTRVIQLPLMKEEELGQAVKWETEAHIPLSIDEVYLDWQIIERPNNHLDHYNIMIAAAPRFLVDSYLSFLRKSGLKPIALEPESVAVVRSLIKPDDFTPTIIVDIGASGTNFVIFSTSAICFTSHIAISGQLFNQAIMENLAVDEKQANQLKIEIGLDRKEEKVYQALEPLTGNLAKQLRDYIAFYHGQAAHLFGPDSVISRVLLCGGDSLLLNLPSFLEEKLNLPVELGNPLINISPPDKRKSLVRPPLLSKKEALTYTTALGLALREVR
ncbi:MAG: type IV pilus assembly protein PilM [Candidatus Portnoybacteria bacterium]|nr:type IV pilus assembly protein PilM [Candidatus Portnoybacteria bacterium]